MKVLKPQQSVVLVQSDERDDFLTTDDPIEGLHIKNVAFADFDVEATSAGQSLFELCDFSGAEMSGFDATDVRMQDCNFTVTNFSESSWLRAEILTSRCSGLDFSNSTLKHVSFKNSKLELSNFRFSKLQNVVFEGCVLNDADFYGAQLKDIEFINCTIQSITFGRTTMSNVDVSQSTIERIKGLSGLKGFVISQEQLFQLAPYLAAEAGIKVK